MSDHVSPVSLYITIFLALMVGTALTVVAAFFNLGTFNFPVAMAIAVVKASLRPVCSSWRSCWARR
jgi:caa(3)-type oxidase subunit IV